MGALLVTTSVVRTLARHPGWWVCALLLALSWPAFRTFLPLGLATADLHHWTAAYEVAFAGGALGLVGAMAPVGRLHWIVRPVGPVRHAAIDGLALFTSAAALGLFALVPAHLFHVWQYADFRAGESFASLLLGWAHLAALATVVLRIPLQPAVRVALVVLVAGIVPGLLAGASGPERGLLAVLDAGGTLRTSFDFPLTRAHWMMASLPIVGLGAVAVALASPPDPHRPPHALRDPG